MGDGTMPELKNIPLHLIDEPDLPMRASMDEQKLLELQNSITNIGQRLPAEVIEKNGRYEIRTGHRRFVVLQRLGREHMMCLVLQAGEDAGYAGMLAENAEREGVNRAEEAVWMAQLVEKHNTTEDQLCALVKKSPDYVGDNFRLLKTDEQVFTAVLERKINFSVARELNKCDDQPMRRNFLDQAIRSGTSARVVTEWVRNWRISTGGAPTPVAQPQAESDSNGVPAYAIQCEFCGGHKDPYNMVSVYVHKWELENMKKIIERLAREGEA
jgi:ParB/RepB/Spo0J family partition protein